MADRMEAERREVELSCFPPVPVGVRIGPERLAYSVLADEIAFMLSVSAPRRAKLQSTLLLSPFVFPQWINGECRKRNFSTGPIRLRLGEVALPAHLVKGTHQPLVSLLALNGLRVSEALAPTSNVSRSNADTAR